MVFMFDMANGSEQIKEGILREAGSDPDLLEVAQGALGKFSLEVLAIQLAAPLETSMPASEIAQCARFVASPASSALAKAADGGMGAEILIGAYRSLSAEHKSEADLYFGSACAKKVGEYLNSEQARSISRAYGQNMVCQYAKEASQPMLAALRGHGRCGEIGTGAGEDAPEPDAGPPHA
ncbi:MAG: hypothetical protein ABWX93_11115 [Pseudoxanthomonas sp.]